MAAAILQLADAIVAALNDHDFEQPVTAVRTYLPRYRLEELDQVKLTIVPKDDEGEREARGLWQDDYSVDLAIQKRLTSPDETTEMDGLVLLGQRIVDFLRSAKLGVPATFLRSGFAPLFDPDHLEQHQTLTTVVNLVYRGWRN